MDKTENEQVVESTVLAEAEAECENGPLIEDEVERSKVGIMRALCDRQDPSTKVRMSFYFFVVEKKQMKSIELTKQTFNFLTW